MKKSILLAFLLSANCIVAQDSLKVALPAKPNKIIFMEYYGGFGGGRTSGLIFGATVNYQIKKDLLTFRLGGFSGFDADAAFLAPVVVVPVFVQTDRIVDYSLLYGKRWIGEGTSFSVSGGVSLTNWKYIERLNDQNYDVSETGIGFPFELNIKWFKKVKRRYRAYYGLIPVTKQKVAFGRSFGFKFVGNISNTAYYGFAFNVGFGTHKKY